MKSERFSILSIISELERLKKGIFTLQEFRRIFSCTPPQAKHFLETYTRRGVFVRLKPGLYGVRGLLPKDEMIANALYQPSYLSFEYALSKYGVIPESVYTLTSATTKPTRVFSANGQTFSYHTIARAAFTGYRLSGGAHPVLMAEPEKALVDYLYFVALGKKSLVDRVDCSRLDKKKVFDYARLYHRPALFTLITTVCSLDPS
ncbi:MAG: hypothetical protein AAB855_01105 [Patescibacteria group bacterium]